MTVRSEIHASIPASRSRRNAARSAFPALSASRARGPHLGPALVAVAWAAVLAFLVLAVAAPAAGLHGRPAPSGVDGQRIVVVAK